LLDEIGYVILQLFLLLLLAKALGYLFGRFNMPELVGEIIAGIVFINLILFFPQIGAAVHFDPLKFSEDANFLNIMGELGIIFLLFTVGLETKFSELMKVGRAAVYVAVLGIIIPLIGGYMFGHFIGYDFNVSLLIGTAMFAMSTGITIEVLRNLHAMNTKEARVIVGASIIDDILCLTLLAVVSGVVTPGADMTMIILNTVTVTAFLAVSFLYISKIKSLASIRKKMFMTSRREAGEIKGDIILEEGKVHEDSGDRRAAKATSLAMIVCLGMAVLSSTVGLAGIIGAFLAGMIFAEFKDTMPCEKSFNVLTAFMLPFFFIYVGMQVQLPSVHMGMLWTFLGLTAVAVATKFIGGYAGARLGRMKSDSSVLVGSSMVPRGEVGIIVATIGLSIGVFTNEMFTVLILMTLATSLIAPPMISWSYRRMVSKRNAAKAAPEVGKEDS
jgi:Kef-type K+ transport system membrane component KefB